MNLTGMRAIKRVEGPKVLLITFIEDAVLRSINVESKDKCLNRQ